MTNYSKALSKESMAYGLAISRGVAVQGIIGSAPWYATQLFGASWCLVLCVAEIPHSASSDKAAHCGTGADSFSTNAAQVRVWLGSRLIKAAVLLTPLWTDGNVVNRLTIGSAGMQ